MKTKYFENEGRASAGGASTKEIRAGYSVAEVEPDRDDYYPWGIEDAEPKFGGTVGRPEGEER